MSNDARTSKIAVKPGEPPKDAVLVDVIQAKEPWSEYTLSDGSIIKMRSIVAEVWRVTNEYDAEGNPTYVIKAAGMMNVMAPEQLKKK